MSLLSEILAFAKAPNEESINISIWSKLSKVLSAFFLCILSVLFTAILLAIISSIVGEDIGKQKESLTIFKSSIENFFLIVFIAPFIEELTYRFFLRRNMISILISLFFIIYFAISILNDTSFYNFELSILLPKITMAAIPVLILYFFLNLF